MPILLSQAATSNPPKATSPVVTALLLPHPETHPLIPKIPLPKASGACWCLCHAWGWPSSALLEPSPWLPSLTLGRQQAKLFSLILLHPC